MKMKRVVKMPLRRTPPARLSPSSLRARTATADEVYEEEDYDGAGEPSMKFMHALLVVLILHVIAVAAIFAFNSIKAKQAAEVKADKPAPAEVAPAAATTDNSTAPQVNQTQTPPVAVAPEKPKAEPKAPVAAAAAKTYAVKAGDTLAHIATAHGVTTDALEKANSLTSTSMIRVGQVLKIPDAAKDTKPAAKLDPVAAKTTPAGTISAASKAGASTAAVSTTPAIKPVAATTAVTSPPAAKPASPAAAGDVYVVAKGENPYSIAKKLHVSYNGLLTLNNIKDPTKVQIGQKLKIPAKKTN